MSEGGTGSGRPDDEVAFERWYALHFKRIRSLCAQILRDPAMAEDIAQETLLRAWTRRAQIREDEVGAWLSVVARNLCISAMRRDWRNVSVDELPETPDEDSDPAAVVLSLDSRRTLRSAFGRLGARHRRVLYMREVGEADYDAIGSELGLTAEGARSVAFRARRVLRDHLAAVGEGFSGVLVGVRVRIRNLRARARDAMGSVEAGAAPAMQAGMNLALAMGVTLGTLGGGAAIGSSLPAGATADTVAAISQRPMSHEHTLSAGWDQRMTAQETPATSPARRPAAALIPQTDITPLDPEDHRTDIKLTVAGTHHHIFVNGMDEDGYDVIWNSEDAVFEPTCEAAPVVCWAARGDFE